MKKSAILIAAFLLCRPAFAQEMIFGILAGGNISSMSGDGTINIGNYVPLKITTGRVLGGGFIGGVAQLDFKAWGVRGEVSYSQQGTQFNADYLGGTLIVSRRSNSVNIPVMAYVKALDDRLSIMLGPQLGIAFGGADFFGGLNTRDVPDRYRWSGDDFNVLDVSACLGVEYLFIESFGIFARYNHGFLNVFKRLEFEGYSDSDPYGKNRVVQIGLVYKFGQ